MLRHSTDWILNWTREITRSEPSRVRKHDCTITHTIRVCSSRWFLFYLLPWAKMLSKNKRSVNRQPLFDHWLINTCQATVVKDNFNDMTCYLFIIVIPWGWPWPTKTYKALGTSVSSHENSHNALGNTGRWFCFCARRNRRGFDISLLKGP